MQTIYEGDRAATEATSLMRRGFKRMLTSDVDWLRTAFLADEYWSLYFFCKVAMGYQTIVPEVHMLFCEVLDSRLSLNKLCMLPRNFVKSWILYAKIVRSYLQNNNDRYLLAMATEELSRKASDFIAGTMERNQIIRALWPDNVPSDKSGDRWTTKARTLPRTREAPEPTITFAGVKTELVSGHYNKIFLDDIFAKEAAESEEIAKKAFAFVVAMEALKDDPKTTEVIHTCTRWGMEDIAAGIMGAEHQKTSEVISWGQGDPSFLCMKLPIIIDDQPTWEQKFPMEEIIRLQKFYESRGVPHMFALQHMNDPMDASVVVFPKPRYWHRDEKGDIVLEHPSGDPEQNITIRERDLYVTFTWDPAYKEKKAHDDSALCVMGTHPAGYRINLYSWVGKLPPQKLAREIVNVVRQAAVRGVPINKAGMETNAQQLAFRQWIKEIANNERIFINWAELKTPGNVAKHQRIHNMVPFVAEGMYYTHRTFIKANQEMAMFPSSRRDNWLDAFAYQPQIWPVAGREQPMEDPDEALPWRESLLPEYDMDRQRPKDEDEGWEGYGG